MTRDIHLISEINLPLLFLLSPRWLLSIWCNLINMSSGAFCQTVLLLYLWTKWITCVFLEEWKLRTFPTVNFGGFFEVFSFLHSFPRKNETLYLLDFSSIALAVKRTKIWSVFWSLRKSSLLNEGRICSAPKYCKFGECNSVLLWCASKCAMSAVVLKKCLTQCCRRDATSTIIIIALWFTWGTYSSWRYQVASDCELIWNQRLMFRGTVSWLVSMLAAKEMCTGCDQSCIYALVWRSCLALRDRTVDRWWAATFFCDANDRHNIRSVEQTLERSSNWRKSCHNRNCKAWVRAHAIVKFYIC